MKHIKTPVKRAGLCMLDADGAVVAQANIFKDNKTSWMMAEAFAHLDDICTAVNAHDVLAAALRKIDSWGLGETVEADIARKALKEAAVLR